VEIARQRIQGRIGICSKAEFLFLSDQLDRASDALNRAQFTLDDHVATHCCLARASQAMSAES